MSISKILYVLFCSITLVLQSYCMEQQNPLSLVDLLFERGESTPPPHKVPQNSRAGSDASDIHDTLPPARITLSQLLIQEACSSHCNINEIIKLLTSLKSVDAVLAFFTAPIDIHNNTIMHVLAGAWHPNLREQKHSINHTFHNTIKAIITHIQETFPDAIQKILSRCNTLGHKPLDSALINNHIKTFMSLFACTVQYLECKSIHEWLRSKVLHRAAQYGNSEAIRVIATYCFETKQESLLKELLLQKDTYGETPLHVAVDECHLTTVETIIDAADQTNDSNFIVDLLNSKTIHHHRALDLIEDGKITAALRQCMGRTQRALREQKNGKYNAQ